MNEMQIREIGFGWRFEVTSDSRTAERVLAALDDCPCGDPECRKVKCQGSGKLMDPDDEMVECGDPVAYSFRACVHGRGE